MRSVVSTWSLSPKDLTSQLPCTQRKLEFNIKCVITRRIRHLRLPEEWHCDKHLKVAFSTKFDGPTTSLGDSWNLALMRRSITKCQESEIWIDILISIVIAMASRADSLSIKVYHKALFDDQNHREGRCWPKVTSIGSSGGADHDGAPLVAVAALYVEKRLKYRFFQYIACYSAYRAATATGEAKILAIQSC